MLFSHLAKLMSGPQHGDLARQISTVGIVLDTRGLGQSKRMFIIKALYRYSDIAKKENLNPSTREVV